MRVVAVLIGIAAAVGVLILSSAQVQELAASAGVPAEAREVLPNWIRLIGGAGLVLTIRYACNSWASLQYVLMLIVVCSYWIAAVAIPMTVATENWQVMPTVGTAIGTALVAGFAAFFGFHLPFRLLCWVVFAAPPSWWGEDEHYYGSYDGADNYDPPRHGEAWSPPQGLGRNAYGSRSVGSGAYGSGPYRTD